jgi:hypothetical protein
MKKVNKQTAIQELQNWFDSRKIKEQVNDYLDADLNIEDPMINRLVNGFMYGNLVLKDTKLIQVLEFPVVTKEGTPLFNELIYKPRVMQKDVNKARIGIKSDDTDGIMRAYGAAATGVSRDKLDSMDTADYNLFQAIITYFLL